MDVKDLLTRDKLIIIILLIIFIFFLISVITAEKYGEETFSNDFFSFPVPNNAVIADDGFYVSINGPYDEYRFQIIQLNVTASDLNRYVDEFVSYEDYNQTHLIVKGDYSIDETEDDYLISYFAIITPKDAFDLSSLKFKDNNGTYYLIKANNYDFMMHIISNLKIGD